MKKGKLLSLIEISQAEFCEHIEDDDFFLAYGNPVVIRCDSGGKVVAIAWSLAERIMRASGHGDEADEVLRKVTDNDFPIITRMGLLFMDPKERKERLDALMDGNAIHCDKVGELIDACKEKCYELTARECEAVSEQEKIKIRWMLTRIDGLKVARQMDPDELAEWVLDLRENGTIFSIDDLRKVTGAMMKME